MLNFPMSTRMRPIRRIGRCIAAALLLRAATTAALPWAFAAWGSAPNGGRSVYETPDRMVTFGRYDGVGMTSLTWRI